MNRDDRQSIDDTSTTESNRQNTIGSVLADAAALAEQTRQRPIRSLQETTIVSTPPDASGGGEVSESNPPVGEVVESNETPAAVAQQRTDGNGLMCETSVAAQDSTTARPLVMERTQNGAESDETQTHELHELQVMELRATQPQQKQQEEIASEFNSAKVSNTCGGGPLDCSVQWADKELTAKQQAQRGVAEGGQVGSQPSKRWLRRSSDVMEAIQQA